MSLETEVEKRNSELTTLLLEVIKNQKRNFKVLHKLLFTIVICYTVVLLGMVVGFFLYESQFDYATTDAVTETITQEVDGENSSINNVQGNQYNDNAIHNEGKDK